MEPPLPQEAANTAPVPSNPALSPPSSGIRAIPSRDDSDVESFMLSDGVPPIEVANEGFSSTSSSIGSSSSDSDKEEEVEQVEKAVPFVDGKGSEEFSTPRAGVPIAKISLDDDEDDDVEEEVSEGFGIGGSAPPPPPKVVLASRVGVLDGDEDDFRTAVTGSRNPHGAKFDDLVTESGHVLEVVKEGEEDNGVEFTSERDAVVDSINVDLVEVVRSGVAVVGEVVEDEPFVVKSEAGVENGVELSSEGDAVVDSIKVDPAEFVRSGVAVVGEAVESEGLGGEEEVENSAAEEPSFAGSNDVEVVDDELTNGGDLVVDSVDDTEVSETKEAEADVDEENSASASAVVDGTGNTEAADAGAGEVDGAKIISEEDSVVEKINIDDVTEVFRSGAVVVGEHEVKKGVEANVNGSAVDESISTELESYKHDSNTMEAKENGSAVDDSISTELESYKHGSDTIDDVSGQEKSSDSVDNLPSVNSAAVPEVSPEGLKSEVLEQTDGNVDVVPGGDEEKVQEVQTTGDGGLDKLQLSESTEEGETVRSGVKLEAENEDKPETDDEDLNGSTDGMVFGSSAAARQFMKELERAAGGDSQVGAHTSHEHTQEVDGQIVTDSEEEADSDNEQDGQELFDSAALAALLKAATNANADPESLTIHSQDGTRVFSMERPAGLGSSLRSVRPSARPLTSSMFAPPGVTTVSEESLSEEEREKLEKLQQLRVKFLRLVYRLGHSAEDSVATQVLYRLALVAGRPSVPSFSLDAAKQAALDLEEESKVGDLDLSLNILVLGKSGVGKSATINSIFGEEKVKINAFEPGTTTVTEIAGVVSGVNVRVFDTPGLRSSALEQGFNRKVLASVKKITKKSPPDIVLYVDRLDSQTKDLNDLPMLRTITSCLGSSIWRNAIVTLTHAACAPPDGPSGSPLSYEVFVAQRSHIVQQYIGQAVGDFRLMSPGMMNPVSLVENHLACRRNREGQKVLPNGQTWKPQLMLLCFSMKILSEASAVSKASESNDQRKLFAFRVRPPPLPYLLSSLLQPRAHPKLPADQGGDNADSDVDPDDFDDLDGEEEEDEYDQLPPFKPLRKAQIARLSNDQRKAYFEEYDYRVKLLQKKQWKEELKRMRDSKNKGATNVDEYGQRPEDYDQENEIPAAVPVPLPDMALPPTFDGDNPAYRYRFLEPTSQFLARPVLDTHGWDHDCGYDGVNIEQNLGIAGRFPAALTVQVTKDKKDFNLHLDSSVAAKHGENGSSLVGFDIQNIGKQMGYVVRGETKFKNLKKNKTAAGVSVTFLGENIATGVKFEDQISLGKRLVLVGSGGTVRSQKDAAYGANIELRLKDAEYPIGQDQSSFVLSLMKWKGDLAIGANLQSQISVGRNSKMVVRVALNNKRSGQITVRMSSSEHLQLALIGLLPIAVSIYKSFRPGVSENYPIY